MRLFSWLSGEFNLQTDDQVAVQQPEHLLEDDATAVLDPNHSRITTAALSIHLLDLGRDVLLLILGRCDVSTVLSVATTCRELHALAMVKQLWIWLVHDLMDDGLIEALPFIDPSQLSVSDLIDQIRKIVLGPSSWKTPSRRPLISTGIIIPLGNPPPEDGEDPSVVHFANGGRQVVISHRRAVEIWDLKTKRRLWGRSEPDVTRLLSEGSQHGTCLTVAFLSYLRLSLEVVCIHLMTGRTEVASIPIPDFTEAYGGCSVLGGCLVVVPLRQSAWDRGKILLIDWRSQTHISLTGFRGSELPQINLLPGHVVITAEYHSMSESNVPHTTQLAVYPLAAFDSLWQPNTQLGSTRTPISSITPLILERLQLDGHSFFDATPRTVIHADPLRRGTYQITIHIWASYGRHTSATCVQRAAALIQYAFDPAAGTLRLKSTRPASVDVAPDRFAYSRYALEDQVVLDLWSDAYDAWMDPAKSVSANVVAGSYTCLAQDLSPYSCLVASLRETSVEISSYL